MKTTARNIVSTLLITLSALALSATANAAVLNSGAYDGTYATSYTEGNTLSSFTAVAGNKYGISATINPSPFNGTDDQTGNVTYIGFSAPLQSGSSSKSLGFYANNYIGGGTQYLFVNPIAFVGGGTGTPGNLLVSPTSVANPYGPLNVGLLLDTTQATWTLSYYTGGTGFNDTAVYQGGSSFGATVGIDPTQVQNGIYLTYAPVAASGAGAQSVVSNFRVVDSVPEPSTYALVLGGIATLLLIRRRVQA
jgi:hypothetical protein